MQKKPSNYTNGNESADEFEQKPEKFDFTVPKRQQLKRKTSDFFTSKNQMDLKIDIK